MKPREFTENEVRVVRSMLAADKESEEDRIRGSGIPRSTYREAKQRIYSQRILEDRYVPDPSKVGVKTISFILIHSRPGRSQGIGNLLNLIPHAVHIWSGVHSAFGVIFHTSSQERDDLRARIGTEFELGDAGFYIETSPSEPEVPIYFDFEGGWSHLARIQGLRRYPRSLPLVPAGRKNGNELKRSLVAEILRRPFEAVPLERALHRLGPATLPKSHRQVIKRGIVEWRTFLKLDKNYLYRGWRFSDIVLIHGKLRSGKDLLSFYSDLVALCGIYPFLLATDGSQVLIGSLALEPLSTLSPEPLPGPRHNVTWTVDSYLDGFRYVREPMAALSMHRSHRYDCLLDSV
jgi:hypothetical protein